MAKGKPYQVGYGKPPKHTQFKPGKSGNAKGRPKGAKNLKTELAEELAEKIPLKEAGKLKKVSKQRAMIKSLAAKAISGDSKAAALILNLVFRYLQDDTEQNAANPELTSTDKELLAQFEASVLKSAKSSGKTNET